MNDKEIEEFCKYVYEKTLISNIKKCVYNFILHEINEKAMVNQIEIYESTYSESGYAIVTERDEREWIEASLPEYINEKFSEWEVDSVIFDTDVRPWYDNYLVPKLETLIDVIRM